MESILTSVKNQLGIMEDYDCFDAALIMHINSVFLVLTQLGVGPSEGFFIEDDSSVWTDFIQGNKLEMVKSYMYLKVKLLFDPPANSTLLDATNRMISEFEWRLNLAVE
jgi:hypothetical protein